ncbi:MAG TPA: FtsX-like permease family protein, partial [Blastocatellia bacterium]|nr:FtsX-like permease family protein [Blastocatellia bacterium]
SGRGTTAAGARRLRSLLVISQMALTLILLINAGLLGKSFYRLLQNDPGFRPESAVVMDLSLPRYDRGPQEMKRMMANIKAVQEGKPVPENELMRPDQDERQRQTAQTKQQILERLSQLPGVIAVGSINTFPLRGGGSSGTFLIDNDPSKTGSADYRVTSPGYFAAMGIPLLRGRLFDQSDRSDSPPVAVISQVFAERYWPDENPIGKRIQFGNMDGDIRLIEIVGVVGNVRDRGLEANPGAILYAYDLQRPQSSSMSVVLRAQADPMSLVPQMRQAVQSVNSELPTSFRTIEQIFSASLDTRRFSLVIFGVFASVALILAIMGIYGVMSYTVTQSTHEIGIRMALGAQRRDVLKLVVGQGLVLSMVGIGIGVVAAFGVTRLVSSLLYGVSATDLTTFAAISAVLASAALVASYVPARRATRVDPMIALREE